MGASATIQTLHDVDTGQSPDGYYNETAKDHSSGTGGFRITITGFGNTQTHKVTYSIVSGIQDQTLTGYGTSGLGTNPSNAASNPFTLDITHSMISGILSNADQVFFEVVDSVGGSPVTVTCDADGNGYNANDAFYYDVTPPTVSGVSSGTGEGTKIIPNTIDVDITFSEVVTVVTSGGTPTITLETGSSDASVNYSSGTGSNTLTFTYTVSSGDTSNDLDYVTTSSLARNGGTIRDAASNDVTLTLASPAAANSLGANKNFVVDGVVPTVSGVSSSTANGSYNDTNTIPIDVTFTQAVTVVTSGGTPSITLETGTSDATVNYSSGSTTSTLSFSYTVANGHTTSDLDYTNASALALNSGTIKDANGNTATLTLAAPGGSGSLGANKALVIDTDHPSVSSVSSSKVDGSYTVNAVISITVTFDEAVTVTGTPQITLETGTSDAVVDYTSGSETTVLTFNYTVASGHTSSDLDFKATSSLALNAGTINDAAGNAATLTLASPGAANSLGANKALVIDTTAPTVSSVSSSKADATYMIDDEIDVTVTFDEAVTVTGTPTITLETGTSDAVVNYSSGSGGTILTFTYTVAEGHVSSDLDYFSTGALSGTIKDAAENDATLTLATPGAANSLGANKALVIDGVRPTVTSVTSSKTNGSYKEAVVIAITVTFDDNVTVTGTPQLTLETGASDAVVDYTSGSTTTILTFTYTVASGQTSSDLDYVATTSLALNTGTINDASGNASTLTLPSPAAANSLGANKALIIDTTVPTVSSVTSTKDNGSYKVGEVIRITVTFSEAVTVSGSPTLTLETGTTDKAVAYTSGSGSTVLNFDYTVESGHTSSDLDYEATTSLLQGTSIQDAALNDATLTLATPGAANSLGDNKDLVIDTTVPTVSSVSSTTDNGSYKAAEVIPITVTFSEDVTVTGTPSLTLETGTSDAVVDYSSGTGTSVLTFNYTVASPHTSSDLDYQATTSLALNAGTIQDAALNDATLTLVTPGQPTSLAANKALIIDTTVPTVSSVSSSKTDGSYMEAEEINVTVTFSEAVTVTGTPQLTLKTGTDNTAVDYASGTGTTILTFTYTVASGDSSLDLDYAATTSLGLNGGTIRDAAANDATLTLATPGAANSLGANKAIVIDAIPARVITVSSTKADGSYKADDVIPITVKFSEIVIVTGNPQLTLETGSTDAVVDYTSGSGGITLTFDYTVASGNTSSDLDYQATTSLALNAGTIKDATGVDATLTLPTVGAPNSLGANKALIIDTTAPTVSGVSSTKADGSYKVAEVITIAVIFSENVTVTGTPQLTLETGTSDAVLNYTSGTGNDTLLFDYTVASGHTSSDLDYQATTSLALNGGTFKDAAANEATLTLATPGATNSLGANKALIIDTTAPTVSSVSSSKANGAYTVSEVIPVLVLFDENVIITGTPQLTLETGTSDAVVNYTSGSSNDTLIFNYTVVSGHLSSDLDYSSTTGLALNEGTIADPAGNQATLTLASPGETNSLGANKAILIDAIAPTVLSVSSPSDNTVYNEGDTIVVHVNISENVTVGGTPTMTLETGSADAPISYTSGSGNDTLVFTYVVAPTHTSGDLDFVDTTSLSLEGATIEDVASNDLVLTLPVPGASGSLGSNEDIVVDTDAPACSLSYTNVSQPTLENLGKAGDEVSITAWFTEKMKSTPVFTIQFADATDSTYINTSFAGSTNDDSTWIYTITSLDSGTGYTGTMVLSISATDLGGNEVSTVTGDSDFEIDNTPPLDFDTGSVIPLGSLPSAGWFNDGTDSLAITVPTPLSSDTSLYRGRIQPRMQIVGIPGSATAVGDPDTLISPALTSKTVTVYANDVISAFSSDEFVQGSSIITWADLSDRVGNVTSGTESADILVIDMIPPVRGRYTESPDGETLISNDTVSITWTGFEDDTLEGESGIEKYEWSVGKFGSAILDSVQAWMSVGLDTSVADTAPLRHGFRFDVSLRAVDRAGNRSDTVQTVSGFLRSNSAPDLAIIDGQFVKEEVPFSYQVVATDIDIATLLGDTLRYWFLDDTSGRAVTLELLASDTLIGIDSVTGAISWDTPFHGDTVSYPVNVSVTDEWGFSDTTAFLLTVNKNNAPDIELLADTITVLENDTLFMMISAPDPDDSTVTFEVTADSLQIEVIAKDTADTSVFVTLIPEQFWIKDSRILITATDATNDTLTDSVTFVLDVLRVLRPRLALSLAQNTIFTRYYELMITDTAEKVLDVTLTINPIAVAVSLDSVGPFTWVGNHEFDTTGVFEFVMYGNAEVGDTTITRSSQLSLARAKTGWSASSPDGMFRVEGRAGSVSFDQPFMIVDSLLFSLNKTGGGLYRMGLPIARFDKPVMVTLPADTARPEKEQAIYQKSQDDIWRESPTVSRDGNLLTWTSSMGYFKLGRRTLTVPEKTALGRNYPNPFNPRTRIPFDIGFFGGPDQRVTIAVYNILGQEVKILHDGRMDMGYHEVVWHGMDKFEVPVSSGVYIVRLATEEGVSQAKKMTLLR